MTRLLNGPVAEPHKPFYEIRNKTEKAADLFIYNFIGDSWDGVTAKQFAMDLNNLGKLDVLNIYINSVGGSVFEGVAIYNVLARNNARKKVIIDGIAASIASVIAMVGDEIEIGKNAMMMIHNPYAMAIGGADELRSVAERLDVIRATLIETYDARTKQGKKKIGEWMDAETWFSAAEAVRHGFADRVSAVETAVAAMVDPALLSGFRNVPVELKSAGNAERKPHPLLVRTSARLVARRPSAS